MKIQPLNQNQTKYNELYSQYMMRRPTFETFFLFSKDKISYIKVYIQLSIYFNGRIYKSTEYYIRLHVSKIMSLLVNGLATNSRPYSTRV